MSTHTTEPVVHKTIVVNVPPERAFAVFTEGLADWWPLRTHSLGQERAVAVTLERREGGRLYESIEGGEQCDWARVEAWEPPLRIVLAWFPGHPPDEATRVEVRFTAEGDVTRVDLEHRGWDALGSRAAELRTSYDGGWNSVLAAYVEAAGG
jgi:uncharacterized protein YndB with AHSA1/START domain